VALVEDLLALVLVQGSYNEVREVSWGEFWHSWSLL